MEYKKNDTYIFYENDKNIKERKIVYIFLYTFFSFVVLFLSLNVYTLLLVILIWISLFLYFKELNKTISNVNSQIVMDKNKICIHGISYKWKDIKSADSYSGFTGGSFWGKTVPITGKIILLEIKGIKKPVWLVLGYAFKRKDRTQIYNLIRENIKNFNESFDSKIIKYISNIFSRKGKA